MKLIRTTYLVAGAMLAALTIGAGPAQAAAIDGGATIYNYKGSYASASSFTDEGCIISGTYVEGIESGFRMMGGGAAQKYPLGTALIVGKFSYDWCNAIVLEDISGGLDQASATTLNGLTKARLKGTVTANDWLNGGEQTMLVDLTLTASARAETYRYHFASDFFGARFVEKGIGRYRSATVTGSVMVGATDILDGIPMQGTLASSTSGSIQIGSIDWPDLGDDAPPAAP